MAVPHEEPGSRRRVREHRRRLRAQGLRPIQIWVPDTRAPRFGATLHRQVARLRGKPEERDAFDLIESIGDAEP